MSSTYIHSIKRSGNVISCATTISKIYIAEAIQVAIPIIAKSSFSLAIVVQCKLFVNLEFLSIN
jgi:hypothetical protein